jgi:DNA-binding CsgD family transcriptional regulator
MIDLRPEEMLMRAHAAMRDGSFSYAWEILQETQPSADKFLLQAHAGNRLKSADEVITLLNNARVHGYFNNPRDAALAAALLSCQYTKADFKAMAQRELDSVLGTDSFQNDDEVAYYTAFAHHLLDDHIAAKTIVQTRTPAQPAMNAQYKLLRGFIHAALDEFAYQAALSRDALILLLEECPGENALTASAMHALAMVSREIASSGSLELLEHATTRITWTPDLAFEHFHTLRAIAWNYALHGGHHIKAQVMLFHAQREARTPGQEMLAHLDRALVAHFTHEESNARTHLTLADHFYAAIDWHTAHEEEPVLPLIAADIYADYDHNKAQYYLKEGYARKDSINKMSALAKGRRIDALHYAAISRVERKTEPKRALRYAQDAYTLFERMGYRWRAARLALDIHSDTGAHKWLAKAAELLSFYSENSLVMELRERQAVASLTPHQRKVLELLQGGLDVQEIAQLMGITTNTVKKHKTKLFRTFGVKNVVALLRKNPRSTTSGLPPGNARALSA